MSEQISETDKVEFFDKLGLSRSSRNVLSYTLLGISNLVGLGLASIKINHPAIIISMVAVTSIAHFMKCSKHNYGNILKEKDEQIRRLTMVDIPRQESQEQMKDDEEIHQTDHHDEEGGKIHRDRQNFSTLSLPGLSHSHKGMDNIKPLPGSVEEVKKNLQVQEDRHSG